MPFKWIIQYICAYVHIYILYVYYIFIYVCLVIFRVLNISVLRVEGLFFRALATFIVTPNTRSMIYFGV